MNKTVVVDGSVLNIRINKVPVAYENKVAIEDCYIISKDGVEIIRCPVTHKTLLLEHFVKNSDMQYFMGFKEKDLN